MSATLLAPPTKPGLLGEARHVVLPAGIVSTGFPAVQQTCRTIGIKFDPWQVGMNQCILAKDQFGLYAADTVVLSIPRQVGKTFDVGALVFADSIINPNTTTVWTAHRFKVARETFNELKALAQTAALAPHIDPDDITTAAGNESIPFRNGSRIVFAARERGAVRGFSKVRRLILDEAQILTEASMSDLAPTMNQAHNPQIILMGTPPKPSDPSEVFTGLRTEALNGTADDVVYVEFSAPDDCDLDDEDAWKIANPSLHTRTPVKAIRRLRKLLASDDDFAREALGIWEGSRSNSVIDSTTWGLVADPQSFPTDRLTLAVDVSPDRKMAAVGLAGVRVDEKWHVEVDEHRQGVDWVPGWLEQRCERNPLHAVVLDETSGLVESRNGKHYVIGTDVVVTLASAEGRDMAIACAKFYDAVIGQAMAHTDQPQLNLALSMARKRSVAAGWAWNRKSASSDITPLVAVTLALWGAQTSAVKKPVRKRTESRRAVVL